MSTSDFRNDVTLHGRTDVRGPINLPPGITIDGATLNSPTINTPTVNGGTINSPTLVTPIADVISLPEQGGDPAAAADTAKLYSKDVAGITQFFVRASDGTITQLTPLVAPATGANPWGSGVDGALVFDGVSNVVSPVTGVGAFTLVPAASVYTLTRDIYASSIQVDAGVTVNTAGFRVFCTGTLDNEGTIGMLANAGGNGTAGLTGAGGAGGSVSSGANLYLGVAGGPGSAASVGTSAAASSGAAPLAANSSPLGADPGLTSPGANGAQWAGGGGGPNSQAQTGGNVAGSNVNLIRAVCFDSWTSAINGRTPDNNVNLMGTGTSGGGGRGASDSNQGGGGGGGASAGAVVIVAKTITGAGLLRCRGGNGGNGAQNGGGGGGGAGGALVILTSSSLPVSNTTNVTGGVGGNGPGGSSGGNGGAGRVYQYNP